MHFSGDEIKVNHNHEQELDNNNIPSVADNELTDRESDDRYQSGKLNIETLTKEIEQLKLKLGESESMFKEQQNKMKYLMADFDNYRKQIERQMNTTIEARKSDLLLKVLNIRDDFIRSIDVANNNKSDVLVLDGLNGVLKNLDKLLKDEGVDEIESKGKQFDPNIHDAIAFSSVTDIEENIVTNEIRKGYMLNQRLLRPALVEISKKINTNKDYSTEPNN